jgi:hypothetical protein
MQDTGLKALINELKSLKIQEAKIKERESVLIRQIEAIGETESTHKVDRVTELQRPNNNPTTVSGIKHTQSGTKYEDQRRALQTHSGQKKRN